MDTMTSLHDSSHVKIYTVNGSSSGSSSSLPDWLTRKRAEKKGSRAVRDHVEGTLKLIQDLEFPEASIRVKTTPDGHHVVATGTYKPQMRVWDLDQLSLKFERHSDAENVDFLILSDDWTKTLHLQNDRTIEVHTQSGFHYRTRIPRFGRSLAYHFSSCDALFSASGNEVYRLNLNQGRFLNPFVLRCEEGIVAGVNAIDINPAHQLFAFGLEGNGTVQFWDPRSRSSVGILKLPIRRLLPATGMPASYLPGVDDSSQAAGGLSVMAIASRSDGLSYAVGTSTGHTLLYDIRATRPFAIKDQGYGLPMRDVIWIEGGNKMAGDGLVLSADKKVIKIWDRHSPSVNFASMTPATDLSHVHHVPGSGILMLANEGIQMTTYYIPQLGPAPRWANFLENITEELEGSVTRSAYEDYKFVERSELRTLGLDHLIGTAALKPYMHGYFLKLKLYDTARSIANPFAYAEYREKMIAKKMAKLVDGRIRTRKDPGVKVNKALAEKIQNEQERERKKEERKMMKKAEKAAADEPLEADVEAPTERPSLLNDPRFKRVFEDPEYAIDEDSREYALLNPSAVAQAQNGKRQLRTAVEEEEAETDRSSSDDLGGSSDDESSKESETSDSDSSDAGELGGQSSRIHPKGEKMPTHERRKTIRRQDRLAHLELVPAAAQQDTLLSGEQRLSSKDATFGQRRTSAKQGRQPRPDGRKPGGESIVTTSQMPSSEAGAKRRRGAGILGASMEKGTREEKVTQLSESERHGRKERRKGVRSGSKNVFRRLV